MKKKIILIVVVVLAFLLAGFRYMVVEREDILPDEVRMGLTKFFGLANAEITVPETEPTAQPTPEPTPTPVPTPQPTPEPLLENGDRGDEVKAMQERLRELGFMTGAADGKFGPKTEEAVVSFKQHVYNLAKETAVPTETPAPEQTETPVETNQPEADEQCPEEEPEPVFEGKVDEETYHLLLENGFDAYQMRLASGSNGVEVARLQKRLKALGYLGGSADGVYGKQTANAVTAFQRRNKLTEDGVAGETTQRTLFSSAALKQVKPAKPYMLKVSTSNQKVYAYAWNEKDAAYTNLVRTMTCSTGLSKTPTPKGTFSGSTGAVARWGYFPKWKVWAQYLYRIQGSILFHSVLYNDSNESSLIQGSLYKLGSPASHGCVRLSVADARWIYNNCPAGTTVKVV